MCGGNCCKKGTTLGFFFRRSFGGLDHLLWFDHQPEYQKYMVEALAPDGVELKAHMMRFLEVHIVAFALIFGALASFLIELGPAETGVEAAAHLLSAVVSIVAFCGVGQAMAGYNIVSAVAEANVAAVLKSNPGFGVSINIMFVSCIYAFALVQGLVLYTNLDGGGLPGAWYAVGLYAATTYAVANVVGYFVNVMARMALYTGSLGPPSAQPVRLESRPADDEAIARAMLLLAEENSADEESLERLYRRLFQRSTTAFGEKKAPPATIGDEGKSIKGIGAGAADPHSGNPVTGVSPQPLLPRTRQPAQGGMAGLIRGQRNKAPSHRRGMSSPGAVSQAPILAHIS
mmetsp:Transcript_2992/g.6986  ORF Transcript_2992/g.6986 Transcript_2992/m.6986 type:complete len:345 (-) Transcript_2992:121-1155(-)